MNRKYLIVFSILVIMIIIMKLELDTRAPTMQNLVENYLTDGVEILTVVPCNEGQIAFANSLSAETLYAVHGKHSILGWKLAGVSSAHFITDDGLVGYSILPSSSNSDDDKVGEVILYGMAKSPVTKVSYISQDIEYLIRVKPEGYFYVLLPYGINDQIELRAILESGEILVRPYEMDVSNSD